MKVWNYVVIFTGLALLLEFGGIHSSGFTSLFTLIGLTLNSAGIASISVTSSYWDAILGSSGILIGIAAGVGIGFLTRSSPENFIILPFITGTIFFFGSIIIGIVSYAIQYDSWIAAGIGLILIPLGIGFYTSLPEFFRGTD